MDTDDGYYNYFLGHCPGGITEVYGNDKLLYTDIYEGVDAMYSSNNAGLKLYFICDPGVNPQDIGLLFEGQDDLQIVNNWGLQVETSMGNYEFEKPRVYQLNANGTVVILPWTLDWTIPNPGEAKFSGWGEIDPDKTLVIEIGKTVLTNTPMPDNADWGTFLGGPGADGILDNVVDAEFEEVKDKP